MTRKTSVAIAAALATPAVAAPAASAAITAAPLTVAASGANVTFTITAPAASPTPDRIVGLFVAPAGAPASTFTYAAMQSVGEGAAKDIVSNASCQGAGGPGTPVELAAETAWPDDEHFVVTVAAADLPASFDAKVVIADDFDTDLCTIDGNNGIATTMDGAQRFPVPAVVPTPVATTPAPAPAPAPTPAPVATPKAVADPDKDGIKNDWLAGGMPVAAPKAAKVAAVTAHGATLTLPKAPKGATIRVYVRVAGTGTFKAVPVKVDKKTGTARLSGLKAGTGYEVKLVAVNKAGQQTTASKAAKVKTTKK